MDVSEKRTRQLIFVFFLEIAGFFWLAGTLWWPEPWIVFGLYLAFVGMVKPRADKGLVKERSEWHSDAPWWDYVLVSVFALSALGVLMVAALDVSRYGWSEAFPVWVEGIGFFTLAAGLGICGWAMVENRFFSTVVRIQKERGHQVIETGPYSLVRHPGYVALNCMNLGTALALGSRWALIPAFISILSLIIRTAREDKHLQEHLPGYADYTRRVVYRLCPGLW